MVCPEEADLLAFAAGEVLAPHLSAHVVACPNCRTAVLRLQTVIGCLRSSPHGRHYSTARPSAVRAQGEATENA
jgi:anti-sigma factor ChrR (cupin superfamily)